jgi:hypothetical protein
MEVVAIDWESTGLGPVGADLATLVSGSLRKGDYPADKASELDSAVMDAHLAGLRDAGWSDDPTFARLGYTLGLALRCWFVRDTLQNLAESESRPLFGRARDVPSAEVLDSFAAITRFLLDRADEARSLAMQLLPSRSMSFR